ncbi:MAG: hypothetical protein ACR652_22275 [Methylocystis sp.]|uniref:hypothetical protein n=1 Tax=Methylocystis sp. TaxID=1911079 RepID=UPI003DA4BA7A
MRRVLPGLVGAYALLLILLAAEIYGAFLPLARPARLLLLIPALLMAGVVATAFMGLRREGAPTIMFAVSGALWLAILLGLGMLDPVTRAMYPAPQSAVSATLKSH